MIFHTVYQSNALHLLKNQTNISYPEKKLPSATAIGAIFGIVSFLLTYTFIFPFTLIYLFVPLEVLAQEVFKNSWQMVGISVSGILFICVAGISYSFYRGFVVSYTNPSDKLKSEFIIYFSTISVFLHPLFFYLSFAPTWNGLRDGQVIFQVFNTFPISSLSLIIIGIVIDFLLKRNSVKDNPPTD